MPATNKLPIIRQPSIKEKGVAAVEFAIVAIIFFILFFGIVELARTMYMCNTLQEVTRRAAALAVNTNFADTTAMQDVREKAIFRSDPGLLVFGEPITDQHVKIDYLHIPSTSSVPVPLTGGLPASPEENRVNCTRNLNDPQCIQLVRVRICLPGGSSDTCDPVPYQTLVSLIPFPFSLPVATTIARVETLGLPPGTPCNC